MKDTICAVATLVGESSINVIRISGQDAIKIVNKIFDKDLLKKESHTITYGFIVENSEKIDEVLVSVFKSPKSFTTEDIVEINSETENSNSVELLIERIKKMADSFCQKDIEVHKEVEELLNEVQYDIMKKAVTKELKG